MRIVVVFPAPLGPRNPSTSPLWTARLTPSTAVICPQRFVRPCARNTTAAEARSPEATVVTVLAAREGDAGTRQCRSRRARTAREDRVGVWRGAMAALPPQATAPQEQADHGEPQGAEDQRKDPPKAEAAADPVTGHVVCLQSVCWMSTAPSSEARSSPVVRREATIVGYAPQRS